MFLRRFLIDFLPVHVSLNPAALEIVLQIVPDEHPNRVALIQVDSIQQRSLEMLHQVSQRVDKAPNDEDRSNRRFDRQQQPKLQNDSHMARVNFVEQQNHRNTAQIKERDVKSEKLHNEQNAQNFLLVEVKDSSFNKHFDVFADDAAGKPSDNLQNKKRDQKPLKTSVKLLRLHL